MLLADLVFAFMWVTYQAFRMKPINRETFPENLIKHAKENEFPVVDVLICTADPFKEPLMRVVNTCLSVMAYDYPTQKLSFHVAEDGRFYAAICAAPAVALGSWGLLKEKKATCYPSFMEQLSSAAIVVESIVQQDGKVVTSRGPDTAMEFIVALVEQLFGKDKANEVSGPLVSLQVHHSLNFSEYRTMVLSSLSGSEAHSKYFGGRPMQQQ